MCHRNHGWTSFSANAEAYNQTFLRDTETYAEGIAHIHSCIHIL